MTLRFLLFALAWLAALQPALGQNVANYQAIPEPLLFLLREPAVQQDLKLSREQLLGLTRLNHGFDHDLLASRTWPPDKAQGRLSEVMAATKEHLTDSFTREQLVRLQQLTYRTRGIRFVLLPAVVEKLALTDTQRSQIEKIVEESQTQRDAIQKQLLDAKLPYADAEHASIKIQTDEQKQIIELLNPDQQRKLVDLIGPAFDLQQLGSVTFSAPDIPATGTWINSSPQRLRDLRGRVVAVHFWTFGCINCIHNYPWYKQWYDAYTDQGLVLLGVHTPETDGERQVEQVREKVKQEGFKFPIVIDNDLEIWKQWGNSMWPSVYLVDKQGRIRYWWYGELNWENAGGQKIMAQRIQELLAETDPASPAR